MAFFGLNFVFPRSNLKGLKYQKCCGFLISCKFKNNAAVWRGSVLYGRDFVSFDNRVAYLGEISRIVGMLCERRSVVRLVFQNVRLSTSLCAEHTRKKVAELLLIRVLM